VLVAMLTQLGQLLEVLLELVTHRVRPPPGRIHRTREDLLSLAHVVDVWKCMTHPRAVTVDHIVPSQRC
jgi:hypothetical protein